MTSKELTYQDIVKLRKQMQENNRNFYEQPIVITYQQAIQIENECLALEQENEKLKNENQYLIECIKTMVFCGIQDKYPLESGMLSNEQWRKMWDTYHKYCEKEVINNE